MNCQGENRARSGRQGDAFSSCFRSQIFWRHIRSPKRFPPLLLITACLLLAGCAHFGADRKYQGPALLPAEIASRFSHNRAEGPFTEKVLKHKEKYTLKRIEFPSTSNILPYNHTICIDYYDVHSDHEKPVIMVLPVLGGKNRIAKAFATYFAENGYASIVVHRQSKYKDNIQLETLNDTFRQIVLDHKQALDWIEKQPDIDRRKIGVFGVSMGGIKSALISALDDRIRASVIALAAGDLPYVLSFSDEEGIVKRRNRILSENKLTLDQFHGQLSKAISCDPMYFAPYMDAKKVLMILAIFDSTVPYAKGVELREQMGSPETIYLFAGHYTSFLYIDYIKAQSMRFFADRFAQEEKEEYTGIQVPGVHPTEP